MKHHTPRRLRHRTRALTALAIGSLIALSACGGGDDESADGNVQVKMATFGINNFSWLSEFALDKGFFERNGLEVDRTVLKSAPIAVSALAGGSVDIIEASPLTTMPLIVKGQAVTMISGETNNPFVFVARKGLDVSGGFPDWLKSESKMKLGVSALGSSGHFLAKAMVEAAGMDDDDVQYVAVGSGPEGNAALDSGKIDGLLTVYPYVDAALKSGHQQTMDWTRAENGEGYPESIKWLFGAPYIGTFASSDWVKDNPDAVEKVQLSLMEASCYVNKPENLSVFASFVKELGGVPESVTDVDTFVADSVTFSAAYPEDIADKWTTFAAETAGFKDAPPVDAWYGSGIAQSDADIAGLVEKAGGSCELPEK